MSERDSIKSPGLQGYLEFEEEELEKSYKRFRSKKHLQGLLKDMEITREKYILLCLILTSIGAFLFVTLDLGTFWLHSNLAEYSESTTGLLLGLIVGCGFAFIKIDHEEKRLTLIQVLLLVGSVNFVLQVNLLQNAGGQFVFWSFGITGFVVMALFITFLTLLLDYSSILARGRIMAFVFIETVVFVLIISIINQAGIEKFTPLLYLSLITPIITVLYINWKKKKLEKPPLKFQPMEDKKHFNKKLMLYIIFIFVFSFTCGLASPVYEMQMVAGEIIKTTTHKENIEFFFILGTIIIFMTIIAFIVGLIFDFFGRLVTISSIIFIISLSTFLNLVFPPESYIHELFIISLIIAVIMTITLLVGDVTKRKNYGKTLTFALLVSAISMSIGQIFKLYIPIWISDSQESNLILLGIQYLTSVICLMLLVNTKETLPHKELEWYESLVHLYIIHKSGLLLFDYNFSKDRDNIQSDLVSGGIIGLTAILEEITKGKERLRTIDHGDKKLLFKYSPKKDVIFVLMIGEELIVLRDKMDNFVIDFTEKYQYKIDNLEGVIVNEWEGVSKLIDKYFTRKYFEFAYSQN